MIAPGPVRRSDRPVLGAGLLLVAMTLLPAMDGMAKYLTQFYPVGQVTWGRYAFHFAALAPFMLWRFGPAGFWPARPGPQIARALFLMAATFTFFAAISAMPMADAIAILFVAPLVVTALSPLLLGERVGPRRWAAVLLGFVGALIIIRPTGDGVGWPALLVVASAFSYSGYALLTRRLAGSVSPLITLMFTGTVGAALLSLWMPFIWVQPALDHWPVFVGVGAVSALGHGLIILAYENAELPVLAPIHYFEILGASLVGYLVFGDFPDRWTWAGAALVVAAGLYVTWREHQLARAARG